MDHADVQRWLDRYIEAWRTYDPDQIGDLFSADAEYRYHPADDPIAGRDAIVRSWTEPDGDASSRDEPGSWEAHYEPYAVDGDRAVAVGWSRYREGSNPSTSGRTFDNCFLLEFDADARCCRFAEFFRQRP